MTSHDPVVVDSTTGGMWAFRDGQYVFLGLQLCASDPPTGSCPPTFQCRAGRLLYQCNEAGEYEAVGSAFGVSDNPASTPLASGPEAGLPICSADNPDLTARPFSCRGVDAEPPDFAARIACCLARGDGSGFDWIVFGSGLATAPPAE